MTLLFLCVTFLSIFLSSSWSNFIWQILPSSFIQFPFRLLSYLGITLAFLSAFVISEMQGVSKKVLVVILFSAVIISSLSYLSPKTYFDKGEGYYLTNEASTTILDEYLPKWVKEKSTQRAPQKIEIIRGKGEIENTLYNNKEISFTTKSDQEMLVQINTIYWPGWWAVVDQKQTSISYNNPKGVIQLVLAPGSHQIKLVFSETPLRLFADSISVASLAILIFLELRKKKK